MMNNLILGEHHNKSKLKDIILDVANFLRPRQKLTPSQWAEKNVCIPEGNAVPGLIRFDNAPYQREPLDCFAMRDVYKLSLMFGAQTGKTNIFNAGIGYCIEYNPQQQMMMQPTQTDIQVWLETKFKPMVDASPYLKKLVAKPRSRKGVNNNKMISYPGGNIMFAWAGSPNTIHGRSPAITTADEVDRYEILSGQGHPANLIEQRSATHGTQSLNVVGSTPSIKGISYIENSFLSGDMRRWHVPCHACGHEQYYKWSCVAWNKDDDGMDIPKSAYYHCEMCGVVWTHRDKIRANAKGRWIATKTFDGHASFHLPELASNFRTWEQIVRSYLDKVATGDLQAFVNLSLAETWEEKGDKIEPHILAQRAIEFSAYIPKDVLILTVGVDVQHDRIEAELVGWTGEKRQSYSIDYKIFYGDVILPEKHPDSPWQELFNFLTAEYIHETGAVMKISCTLIDSGDGTTTNEVYAFCMNKKRYNIYASKGRGGWNIPYIIQSRAEKVGKRLTKRKQSFPLMIVGVSEIKIRLLRDLFVENIDDAGYCYFPANRDPEYFEQLTAEQLIIKRPKGEPIREWRAIRPRNEALDCRVYAIAALTYLKPNYDALRANMIQKLIDNPQIQAKLQVKSSEMQKTNTQTDAVVDMPIVAKKKKKIVIKNGKREVIYF